ncbi:uncharacterized protein [Parasteatoda tepidariorum]|uniref:uncharacterized protein n=1 Tax=Parasteatoda tepidariorum TaxID=114398 RepID=UPI001C718455|nr:uncharacterized protein LOC107441169 [Parasteatoda tepidariorum]
MKPTIWVLIDIARCSVTIFNSAIAILFICGLLHERVFPEVFDYMAPNSFVTWSDHSWLIHSINYESCNNIWDAYVKYECLESTFIIDDSEIFSVVSELTPLSSTIYLLIERSCRILAPTIIRLSAIFVFISIVCVFGTIAKILTALRLNFRNTKSLWMKLKIHLKDEKKLGSNQESSRFSLNAFFASKYAYYIDGMFLVFVLTSLISLKLNWGREICQSAFCLFKPSGLRNTIFKSLESNGGSWTESIFFENSNMSQNSIQFRVKSLVIVIASFIMTSSVYVIASDFILMVLNIPRIIFSCLTKTGNFISHWRQKREVVIPDK